MFKKITALFFMLAFIGQTFSAPFIMLDYYSNTGAYAKNCINKANPTLHCNGKCQVMKKMRAEEKKEQENAERRAAGKTEVLSTKSYFPTVADQELVDIAVVKNEVPSNFIITKRSSDFFHPPQAGK